MTAPIEAPTVRTRSWSMPTVPAPDTPGGLALVAAIIVATVYVLLLVAENVALANQSAVFIPLLLILATIVVFSIAATLGADYARVRQFELELARTISVHTAAGQMPEVGTPVGEVLKEYVRTAGELRRYSRVHAYAAGAAFYGAVLALGAAVFWGISFTTGALWLTYLAVLVELPAFVLLVFAMTVLATSVGYLSDVPGFEALTPRHWRHFSEPNPGLDAALKSLPWLDVFAHYSDGSQPLARPPAGVPGPLSVPFRASYREE